jgi:hypothetical protein
LEGLGMTNLGVLPVHLELKLPFLYNLRPFCIFVTMLLYFFTFRFVAPRKIWQPWCIRSDWEMFDYFLDGANFPAIFGSSFFFGVRSNCLKIVSGNLFLFLKVCQFFRNTGLKVPSFFWGGGVNNYCLKIRQNSFCYRKSASM